ncbi:MAG: DUF177 domain-containing protein [Rhodocyclales bacterium]|nr:DUF177 domain-containing protein [Rhodocyclales bacterium]
MVIDSLEFARRHGALSGRLQLGTLPRLTDVLFDVSGSLDYEVSGETAGDEVFLALKLEGPLRLTCQRCLGALEFALSVRSRVMLVEPGSPWPDDSHVGGLEDEACDAIEASRELDTTPLLEEEILLALPIAPRHEHCEPPAAAIVSKEASPFAKLARLKRN